jgi:hypothetical protein
MAYLSRLFRVGARDTDRLGRPPLCDWERDGERDGVREPEIS